MNIEKFENPQRIKEIDLTNSLIKAGIREDDVLCDYGAGTGIFAVEAAKLTRSKVYALDMSDEMLEFARGKVESKGVGNVEIVKVGADEIPLSDRMVDIFYMVTVLHHIEKLDSFLLEVKRVLKPGGKVMIVEFKKIVSPMGPPIEHRISEVEAAELFRRIGYESLMEESLSENLFLQVYVCES